MSFGAAITGAATGGLMNAGGGVASSALNWYYTRQAAQLKYKYDQKYAENTPTWNKTGYEKAGLNPMLAMGNANSAAQSGMNMGGNMASGSGLGELGTAAIGSAAGVAGLLNALKDNEKKDAEIENLKAQTSLTEASADIENQKAMSGYGTQQGYEIAARVQNLTESANLTREQAMKVVAESDNIRAQLESINLGNELLKAKIIGQDTTNSKSAIELERSVMNLEALRTVLKDNPDILADAISGKLGSEAKQAAKTISEILKNYGTAGSKLSEFLPVGRLGKLVDKLFDIIKIPGKSKK